MNLPPHFLSEEALSCVARYGAAMLCRAMDMESEARARRASGDANGFAARYDEYAATARAEIKKAEAVVEAHMEAIRQRATTVDMSRLFPSRQKDAA